MNRRKRARAGKKRSSVIPSEERNILDVTEALVGNEQAAAVSGAPQCGSCPRKRKRDSASEDKTVQAVNIQLEETNAIANKTLAGKKRVSTSTERMNSKPVGSAPPWPFWSNSCKKDSIAKTKRPIYRPKGGCDVCII